MTQLSNREHINIWLAYSDLFSGALVIALALLLLHLLPSDVGGGEGGPDDEIKRRQEAQWETTKSLYEKITSKGYIPIPNTLEEVKQRFSSKDRTTPDLIRFTDGKGHAVVAIYDPVGEEQRITFGSQILFDNDGPFLKRIKPEGKALLNSVGTIILGQRSRYNEIRVTGHTDVKPPKSGDSFEYNWVLSSERAIAVVTHLLTDPSIRNDLPRGIGEQYDRYKSGTLPLNFPPNRISAIGRGEFEPVGSTEDENWAGRHMRIHESSKSEGTMKQNRRIEIIVRYLPVALPVEGINPRED